MQQSTQVKSRGSGSAWLLGILLIVAVAGGGYYIYTLRQHLEVSVATIEAARKDAADAKQAAEQAKQQAADALKVKSDAEAARAELEAKLKAAEAAKAELEAKLKAATEKKD